ANGTFGKTTLAGNGGYSANTMWATQYTLTEAATITSMVVYSQYDFQINPQIETAIYTNNLSNPQNLIVASAPQTMFNGWNQLVMPVTVLNPGTYWLAFQALSGSSQLYRNGAS